MNPTYHSTIFSEEIPTPQRTPKRTIPALGKSEEIRSAPLCFSVSFCLFVSFSTNQSPLSSIRTWSTFETIKEIGPLSVLARLGGDESGEPSNFETSQFGLTHSVTHPMGTKRSSGNVEIIPLEPERQRGPIMRGNGNGLRRLCLGNDAKTETEKPTHTL